MVAPAALTYDSLLDDLSTYAERADAPFTDQRERFVMLAENRIASEVKGLGFKKFVTGTFTVSNPVIVKPVRWRETESFSYLSGTSRVFLKLRSLEYCRTYWPDSTLSSTTPKYYSDYDFEHFYLAGTPALASSFELGYFERPVPLSTAVQTNWTTEYAPQLLLYACLLEAQPWLKLPERIPEFQAMYDRAVSGITHEDNQRVTDAESNRAKP
jgi:hypothetical protein